MTHIAVTRSPRTFRTTFRFVLEDGKPFDVVAIDASIRGARFSSSDRDKVESASSGQALFAGSPTQLERMKVPRERITAEFFLLTFKTRQLNAGRQLSGKRAKYEILDYIGAGQSAETYSARVTSVNPDADDLRIGDPVVLKIPLFVPYLDDGQLLKFILTLDNLFSMEEANLRRLRALDCVASFVDTGDYPFPRPNLPSTKFMVQKRVRGRPLDEYLKAKHSTHETSEFTGLGENAFYAMGRAIADAIREVHSKLVIHGDIWPENIMVRSSGKPALIDFGQAVFREAVAQVDQAPGRNSRYIAPEGTRSVSGDVYSLGGVLHYLATGQDPPEPPPRDIDVLKRQVVATIRSTNEQLFRENRGAADIIARCLRMSDQRVAHIQGVIEDLDTFFGKRLDMRLSDTVYEVEEVSERLDREGHELFRWMASLRVKSLAAFLTDMTSGVYDLVGDHEVIAGGLTQYLGLLRKGDQYLTISVPKFWYTRNLGVNGRFLAMNAIAAQRGAVVKRLFVVAPSDLADDDFKDMMEAQRQALLDVQGMGIQRNYEVKTLDVEEEARAGMLAKHEHFGLLITAQDEVAIFPEYRTDGSIAAVRFRAGHNLMGSLTQTFADYWNAPKAIPLLET